MPHPIEASTLRILKPAGETVGTGFLVSKNLAVTCAHVVKILRAGAGDTIDIRFAGKSTATTARVLAEYWRIKADYISQKFQINTKKRSGVQNYV